MNKPWRSTLLVVFLFGMASAGEAFALGLGGYLSARFGSADYEIEDNFGDIDTDGDFDRFAVGFTLDTAPAQDRLFSYRLNVGIEQFKGDLDDVGFGARGSLDLVGITVDNMFGFQIFRSAKVRLWGGPHVVVGFYGGDIERQGLPDDDAAMVEFGAGGVFGANFHAGKKLTITTVAGFTFSGYAGAIDEFTDEEDFTGDGGSAFVTIGFLVRIGSDAR